MICLSQISHIYYIFTSICLQGGQRHFPPLHTLIFITTLWGKLWNSDWLKVSQWASCMYLMLIALQVVLVGLSVHQSVCFSFLSSSLLKKLRAVSFILLFSILILKTTMWNRFGYKRMTGPNSLHNLHSWMGFWKLISMVPVQHTSHDTMLREPQCFVKKNYICHSCY